MHFCSPKQIVKGENSFIIIQSNEFFLSLHVFIILFACLRYIIYPTYLRHHYYIIELIPSIVSVLCL
jgi:hypothetical protein